MFTKKLSTAIAAIVLVACVPVTTIFAGQAMATASRPSVAAAASGAPNAWATRSGNLPMGGAALTFDGAVVYGAPHPFKATPVVPNAWATRSSGLDFGGAGLFV